MLNKLEGASGGVATDDAKLFDAKLGRVEVDGERQEFSNSALVLWHLDHKVGLVCIGHEKHGRIVVDILDSDSALDFGKGLLDDGHKVVLLAVLAIEHPVGG